VILFNERDRCLLIGYRNQVEIRHMSGELIASFNRSSITPQCCERGCFIYSVPSKTLVTGSRSEAGVHTWDIGLLLDKTVPLGFGP
jgi:hypothetical protein